MPIMKAQSSLRTRESPIVMDLSDLEREAADILARARAQAAQILADARTTADRETLRIHEQARLTGHAEGLAAGAAEGRQKAHDETVAQLNTQLRELAARWSQTLDLLHQHMPGHLADTRADVVKLAIAIAHRVTHLESIRNRQIAPAIAEEALRLVGAARRVSLAVHPGEVDALEQFLPDLLTSLRNIEEIELLPDDSIPPGGCHLRYGAGEIDARLETQITRIAQELLGEPTPPPTEEPK
jgi:flagellar assembly protein FliH